MKGRGREREDQVQHVERSSIRQIVNSLRRTGNTLSAQDALPAARACARARVHGARVRDTRRRGERDTLFPNAALMLRR